MRICHHYTLQLANVIFIAGLLMHNSSCNAPSSSDNDDTDGKATSITYTIIGTVEGVGGARVTVPQGYLAIIKASKI
ncbi:MAG: hypothetical protein JW841_00445 [Deltaproteobacteria bacterium]|nr:hypothetical protein [Deltaproteobacteria bacterium]